MGRPMVAMGTPDSRESVDRARTLGCVRLLVYTISSKPPSNVLELTFEVAELISAGGNAEVQKIFEQIFTSCDEAGFFDNIDHLQMQVIDVVKPLRNVKNRIVKNGYADFAQLCRSVSSSGYASRFVMRTG